MAVEADLASWATARGGVTYTLINRMGGTSQTTGTTGRLGATFRFNKVNLDMVAGGAGTAPATGNIDSASFDLANGFFSLASLTYHW
jgi:hypothetical protein